MTTGNSPQLADKTRQKSGDAHTHTMPGLIGSLAESFWRDRRSHSPRGMARNNEVAETHQIGACLRDLHARLRILEDRSESALTVRQLQIVRRVA